MKLRHEGAEIFIPDGVREEEAFSRTTHVGIGAHPDDLEIMAYDGILRCFKRVDEWFFGVVVTDGAGSPRASFYKNYTNEAMKAVRRQEQKKAALVGEYSGVAFLNYPSSEVKDPAIVAVKEDLKELLSVLKPRVIYTHNPADRHDTHVAVALRTIQALRELPPETRPEKIYGCEVWRDLDWLIEEDKVGFDVSAHQNLAMALVSVYDSQVAGGKGYDLATIGRRRAHATYYSTHEVDVSSSMIFGLDLTPLIHHDQLEVSEFVQGFIDRFAADVRQRLQRLL
jgi:LmbE family N-acetylglucosaminyl deacetylase